MTHVVFDSNVRLGRLGASRGPHFRDAAELLTAMDRFGVARSLVYGALARESDCEEGNRLLCEQIAGHARLIPCWVASPNRRDADEFVRAMDQNGVPAARLFPQSFHVSIRPWCISALAEALSRRGKTLLIDFESPAWANDGIDWEGVDQLCGAFPALPVIICGVTVAGPANFAPIMARRSNLHLEISQLICPGQIKQLIERGYDRRILFGSDMPTRHIGGPLNMLERESITPAQRQAILRDNLASLLQRPPLVNASHLSAKPAPRFTPVVDTHVHLGGWNNATAGSGKARDIVAQMDRCGVSASVVTSLWSCFGEVIAGNQAVAQACADFPGRIHGYLTLDPKHPEEVQQQIALHRRNPAFVGVKLHCGTHRVEIDDPSYRPILSYADERRLPVLIHGNFTPDSWRKICPQYPNAILIVAHIGGCGPDMLGALDVARLCRTLGNLHFDIASSRSFYNFLEELIDLAGVEKILYGSDHPLFDFAFEMGQVLHSSISNRDKQLILSGNAMRLFRFPSPVDVQPTRLRGRNPHSSTSNNPH